MGRIHKLNVAGKIVKARKWHRPALTQEELADAAGMTRALIARYEAGSNVPDAKLQTIARTLGLPKQWFLDGQDTDPPYEGVKLVEKDFTGAFDPRYLVLSVGLPRWEGIVAGYGEECSFRSDDGEVQEVPAMLVGPHDPKDCRAFKVAGSSMSPRVEHSQLGLVVLTPDAPINTLVMARRSDGALFVKILRPGRPPQPYSLCSVNSEAYPPIEDVEGWQIVGSVIAFMAPPTAGDRNIEWNFGNPLRA